MFKRHLTHRSIETILRPLQPFMSTPDVILCPDQYFRRAIYGLGPHIADYPEQAGLAWILYGWCPTYVPCPTSARIKRFTMSSLVASLTRIPLTPRRAAIGLQPLLTFWCSCMMKKHCESHTASPRTPSPTRPSSLEGTSSSRPPPTFCIN